MRQLPAHAAVPQAPGTSAYRASGLTIVGVHTPEFAFERDPDNVRENARRLSAPVPGRARQRVRRPGPPGATSTGRRSTSSTAAATSASPTSGRASTARPSRRSGSCSPSGPNGSRLEVDMADRLVERRAITPETYLGYERLATSPARASSRASSTAYALPDELARDQLAYGGRWRVEDERIVAGAGRPAATALPRPGRAPRARRARHRPRRRSMAGEQRRRAVTGDRLYTLVRLPERGTHCSSCGSRPASRPTPSRSARPGATGREGRRRGPPRGRARAGSASARRRARRPTAGSPRRSRRRVRAPLELLDVRRGLVVGRDGLAHLLGVAAPPPPRARRRRSSVPSSSPSRSTSARARARARRERDVVRHGRPEAGRRQAGAPAGVVEDADDAGRPLVARRLQPELLDERLVGRRARSPARAACAARPRAALRA